MREIIVDNFAGGGGASTGIEMAIGRSVDIAINHDENAVDMHRTNHPDTLHYCENVFDVDPKAATGGKAVGFAWFSPDCTHYSKARGSKPVKREIRGLAWVSLRWALDVKPRVMALENVEEFKTWGPLLSCEMRPDPERSGETFKAFVGMLSSGIPADHPALYECCEFLGISPDSKGAKRLIAGLGYQVEYRELRASDYGAPTIRKRFFMLMRCDGKPIVWPAASHGDPKSAAVLTGKLAPWRTAAECIDWSIPAPSIFDRKKPLAVNTLKRIARGIQRFVVDSDNPFIVKCNHTTTRGKYDCFRGQGLYSPIQTITKTHGYALAIPTLAPFMAGNGGSQYQAKPRPLNKPAHTILKQSRACVVAPVIARQFGASIGHRADEPSATITAGGGGKSQLVTALLAKHYGGNYTGPGISLDTPAHSVTTVDHHALVTAQIVGVGGRAGQSRPRDVSEPLQTMTTKADAAMVTSHLVKLRGTCRDGQRTDDPMPTITAGGQHVGEVRALLAANDYDERRADQVKEFLNSFGVSELVTVKGVVYRIVDIGMRMLQPHELYRAQGFPEGYIIDRDYRGKRYSKEKQVARCGNAVPPPFAEALVRANLPEMCVNREEQAA
ncbi:DNA cytosine methyltransferase [Klebsiella pneumoniae]|uniref:DNA cytosine methyltransferase n=1 Tax=Klebsiella pneumoniae TaxID=573 RepID=UPI001CBC739F|nr:DNA cytosine methyltransferase [Klebsiella pneumoniae]MBZ1986766.1 DNA cytosine methyltransferase [Klebsiella pneumoniae]HCM7509982.1 DNA cytosine methyltransferase [Klebsiella aerogenes]HCM7941079.1 DNA cytosine methyltransferase [Klebsiella aerogenes]